MELKSGTIMRYKENIYENFSITLNFSDISDRGSDHT